ncbi:hypothetical protein Tco_0632481 [Tanacetum coccineum]
MHTVKRHHYTGRPRAVNAARITISNRLVEERAIGQKYRSSKLKDEVIRGIVIRNKSRRSYDYSTTGFKDPDSSDKVYKVVKALEYGSAQAPRAWRLQKYKQLNGRLSSGLQSLLIIKESYHYGVKTYRQDAVCTWICSKAKGKMLKQQGDCSFEERWSRELERKKKLRTTGLKRLKKVGMQDDETLMFDTGVLNDDEEAMMDGDIDSG